MNKKEIFNHKLELLKIEISILNDRIKHTLSTLWKVRQIALTLWLATIGVGLGGLSQKNGSNLNLLAVSILVPILFQYIDARITRWSNIYRRRDLQITNFLSQTSYKLPSTKEEILFDECLKNEVLTFPVYDLNGELTYGNHLNLDNDKLYRSIFLQTPLLFYASQTLASILLFSLEYKNLHSMEYWWIPSLLTLITYIVLYFSVKAKKKRKEL